MDILVLGGTRFFGVHLVERLLQAGHRVTIATRGRTEDPFGERVKRLKVERTDGEDMRKVFWGRCYDLVYDNLAYCPMDIKTALDAISCGRYIFTSSASVYELHRDTRESDFSPEGKELVWCRREEVEYDEGKKGAESALVHAYPGQKAAFVRFPFVIGEDDYTDRLYFYVKNTILGIPMYVDNPDCRMSFIGSVDAGSFLAQLAAAKLEGPVNACCKGTLSIREILTWVTAETGKNPVLCEEAAPAPYNGAEDYSLNTDKAEQAGIRFRDLHSWIFGLLAHYVERAGKEISPSFFKKGI